MKFFPATLILASGTTSSVLGTDADRGFLLAVLGVVALVFYRLFRKWPKAHIAGPLNFIERNFVELILASVIAPGAFRMVMEAMEKLVGKL